MAVHRREMQRSLTVRRLIVEGRTEGNEVFNNLAMAILRGNVKWREDEK
jgi:hypothetical protein